MKSLGERFENGRHGQESLLETPATRIRKAAQRLVEIQGQIDRGNYTVQTLLDYEKAYSDYIRADLPPRQPSLVQRIKEYLIENRD